MLLASLLILDLVIFVGAIINGQKSGCEPGVMLFYIAVVFGHAAALVAHTGNFAAFGW